MLLRIITTCLLSSLVAMGINAKTISRDKVLITAQDFASRHRAKIVSSYSFKNDNGLHHFVIEKGNKRGYVIINASDATDASILGYSFDGSFDADKMPMPVKNMLKHYLSNSQAITDTPNNAFKVYGNFPAVEPLLNTKWNQDSPYNLACPKVSYVNGFGEDVEGNAVAGCVAIATAQIMNMHQFPISYDWSKTHTIHDSASMAEDNAEVARLIHNVGESIGTCYGYLSSSASVSNVKQGLQKDFGYSPSMIYWSGLNSVAMDVAVYEELQQGRPVLYGAQSENTGHAFVVDGMDSDGLFHINWGWGGLSDGYFHPALLDPEFHGIGGASSAYVRGIEFVTGIRPEKEGDFDMHQFWTDFLSSTDGQSFKLSICQPSGFSSDYYEKIYNLEYGIRIAKSDNLEHVIDVRGSINRQDVLTLDHYNLPDGEYRCFPIWRQLNESWRYVLASDGNQYLTLTVKDGVKSINVSEEHEKPVLSITGNELTETADPYSGDKLRFSLHNEGSTFEGDGDIYAVFSLNGKEVFRVKVNKYVRAEIPAGGDLEIVWPYAELLKITYSNLRIPKEMLQVSVESPYFGKIGELGEVTINTLGFDTSEIECPVLRKWIENSYGVTYLSDYHVNRTDELKIDHQSITSLNGLENFTNLSWLEVQNTDLQEFEIANWKSLQILRVSNNSNLNKVNIHDNPMLHGVDLFMNNISDVKIANNGNEFEDEMINGFSLSMRDNKSDVAKLDLRKIDRLVSLDCSGTKINELYLPDDLHLLRTLELNDCNISNFEVSSGLFSLEKIILDNNSIDELDLSESSKLWFASINNCGMKKLLLPTSSPLRILEANNNELYSLSLKGFNDLQGLYCDYNKLNQLDIVGCKNLVKISVGCNPDLELCDFRQFDKLQSVNTAGCKHLYCALQPRNYQYFDFSTEIVAQFRDGAVDLAPFLSKGMDIKYIHPINNCRLEGNMLVPINAGDPMSYCYTSSFDNSLSEHEMYEKYNGRFISVIDEKDKIRVDTHELYLPNIGDEATFKLYRNNWNINFNCTWAKDDVIELVSTDNFGEWISTSDGQSQFKYQGEEFKIRRIGSGDIDIVIESYGVRHVIKVVEASGGEPIIKEQEIVPIGQYDLYGHPIINPKHGSIVIIVYSDGTSKKVVIR